MDRVKETADFIAHRKTWKRFTALANGRKIEFDNVEDTLDTDIYDKYYDMSIRKTDAAEAQMACELVRRSLEKANIKKILSEEKPVGIEVLAVHVYPTLNITMKGSHEIRIYIQVKPVEGQKLPQNQLKLIELETTHFSTIAKHIAEEKWYKDEYDTEDKSTKLILKVCYNEDIPDCLLTAAFYRACCRYCVFLDPLVYFFHSLMSENWEEENTAKRLVYDMDWLPIQKTAMLVVFFLKHCHLIPLFMDETDTFLPTNVTWQKLKEWDSGEPFFDEVYDMDFKNYVIDSYFGSDAIANLLFCMFHFYTETFPLGKHRLILDNGGVPKIQPHEKTDLVIDSILLRRTSDNFPLKVFYRGVMKKFFEHLNDRETGGCVGEDLMEIRRKMVAERKAEPVEPMEPTESQPKKKKNNKKK